MKAWTIYCHVHIASGRRYIGVTTRSMQRRWVQHVAAARRGPGDRNHWRFASAIRKYGAEAFAHEVLERCSSLEVAEIAERSWVAFYQTTDPAHGFNQTPGGDAPPPPVKGRRRGPMSQEQKNKISAALAGRSFGPRSAVTRERIASALRGRKLPPLPESVKAKISEALAGRDFSDEHRANLSAAGRLRSYPKASPELRAKLSAAHLGKPHRCKRCGLPGHHQTTCRM